MSVISTYISTTKVVSRLKFHLEPKTMAGILVLLKVRERRFLRPMEASMI